MRIIAGIAKGKKLKSFRGRNLRPVTERIKESLFSIISDEIPNSAVLDLYAGTGSLGLEALSRGAAYALFIDNDIKSIGTIKKNLENLGFLSKGKVIKGKLPYILNSAKIKEHLQENKGYNIVFVDPPFEHNLEEPTLEFLKLNGLVAKEGIIVVRHRHKTKLPYKIGNFEMFREEKYGDSVISFYVSANGKVY